MPMPVKSLLMRLAFFASGAIAAFAINANYCRSLQLDSVTPQPTSGAVFQKIWECPIDAFEYFVKINAESRENLVRGIARNAPASESNAVYFAGVLRRLDKFLPPESELLTSLEKEFQKGTDRLYYYYEKSTEGWEEGWLIARDEKVRKRFPLASSGAANE